MTLSSVPPLSERAAWFHHARLGVFIHWGLFSLLNRGEWAMFCERIPAAEYARLKDQFRAPEADPRAWARLIAESGAGYAVLTSRHHEGFCLWPTETHDFHAMASPARRDFVGEFTEACRAEGLRVGLYYSLLDWRFPGYWDHQAHPESAEALRDMVHAQVRELMTGYGAIDLLWYDGAWTPGVVGEHEGQAIADFWRSRELNAMVRQHQPNILINNRSGLPEDMGTPEQHVTPQGVGRLWEACMTMGASWGCAVAEPLMKTPAQAIGHLVNAAKDEGNYLLNIGPTGEGAIMPREEAVLRGLGAWMERHGESIRDSRRCELPEWGGCHQWTRRGTTAYLHLLCHAAPRVVVPLVASEPRRVTLLSDGRDLPFARASNGRLVIDGVPEDPGADSVCVIKVEFDEEPRALPEPDCAAWLAG